MTLEMAVAPIALAMANHPRPRALRPLVAALHHVGRHAGHAERRRDGHRTHRGPLAPRLRRERSAGDRRQPGRAARSSGASTRPGSRSAASSCGWSDLDTGDGARARRRRARSRSGAPSAMAGYLPDEATADAFVDGWYRTGDVGWLEPEGWVHLTDRCKEMIKVSGFQVAPAEIEAVLHGHPAVLDCAVFGVADERVGEVPVAAVQLDPGADVRRRSSQRLVADTLATYKRLHHVVIWWTPSRGPRRARCCAAPCATSGTGAASRRGWADGRPSLAGAGHAPRSPPRWSTASARSRSPQLDDAERAAKLDAAVAASGWRELRTRDGRRAPVGLGGGGRHRRRGARPRPRRHGLPGPDPGGGAPPAGRSPAGQHARDGRARPGPLGAAPSHARRAPAGSRRARRRARRAALVLVAEGDGLRHRRGQLVGRALRQAST